MPVFSRHPHIVTDVWSWGKTTCSCQWLLLCDFSAVFALSSSLTPLGEQGEHPAPSPLRCLPTSLIFCSPSCSLPSSSFVLKPNDLTLHSLLGGVGCERGMQQRRRYDIKSSREQLIKNLTLPLSWSLCRSKNLCSAQVYRGLVLVGV